MGVSNIQKNTNNNQHMQSFPAIGVWPLNLNAMVGKMYPS